MSKINYLILILFFSSLIFSQENLGVEEITVTGSFIKSNNLTGLLLPILKIL